MKSREKTMFRTCLAAVAVAISAQALADETYPTNQCINSLNHDARLAVIADKVALARSDETGTEMLGLDRQPTDNERQALQLWSKLRQFCFDLGAEFRAGLGNQEQAALAGRLFDLHQGLLSDLREGRISYAEFNGRRVELYLIASSLEAQMTERREQTTSPQSPALASGQSEI
jgi:hypothetical protein